MVKAAPNAEASEAGGEKEVSKNPLDYAEPQMVPRRRSAALGYVSVGMATLAGVIIAVRPHWPSRFAGADLALAGGGLAIVGLVVGAIGCFEVGGRWQVCMLGLLLNVVVLASFGLLFGAQFY